MSNIFEIENLDRLLAQRRPFRAAVLRYKERIVRDRLPERIRNLSPTIRNASSGVTSFRTT
jgi:hypothetical protein